MPTRRNAVNNIQQTNIKLKGGKKINWLNIIHAAKPEIDYLRENFHFDEKHLYQSSAKISALHAAVHHGTDYIFLVLRFPYYDKQEKVIASEEIDFFVGKNYVITLHQNKIRALRDFFANYHKINEKQKRNSDSVFDVFYYIVEAIIDSSFDLLDDIGEISDEIEDIIFAGENKNAITVLLNLRRSAINFRSITISYENIFEKFERLRKEIKINDLRTPFSTIIEKVKDLQNITENRKEMIEALYATHESISNYRLNDIMKTLTIFSVIVFPLTLLAAIFGMNTMNGMPFVNTPQGFWLIIIIMLLGSFGMLMFFKKKKWL